MKKLFVLILSIVAAFATATLLTACEAKVDKDGNVTITDDNNNNDHDNNQQERVELTAADIYSKVNPSVVFILLEKKGAYVSGSGFFIDKNGTLVTNYHVIKDTFAGVIQLCDGTVENIVNVLGYDEKLDIAILETTAKNTPAVTKSNEQIRVGENVYAIGYPEAFILGASSSTFTTGMVSMNRSVNGYNYIQSTVDITNGNSGGVLINKYGEAVGITTAGINLEKIDYMNLSIPIQRVDTIQRNVNESLEITTKRHHPVYVTYMADGYKYNVQSITYETKTAAPADPAKVGYTFNGWYLDNGYKKPFAFETILLENITLFAKFSINNYTVSYDLNEGGWGDETPPQTYTIDNCGIALPTPKREGCLFEGWLDGDGKYLLNYPNKSSLQNLSLKASWIKDAEGLVIENGVVKKYNGSLTKVAIPASFRGKSVTSIDNYAFKNCTSLTSITIPNSVTSIGYSAFNGCSGLQEISLPFVWNESSIRKFPFGEIFGDDKYVGGIKTQQPYYDSDDPQTIWGATYYIPSSLKKVTITGGNISNGAFQDCSSLTSVTIGKNVTSIGERMFYGCSSLTNINVDINNKNYKSINGNLYSKDDRTLIQYAIGKTDTSFNIPDSVTEIGEGAFIGCDSLTSIAIPNSVTEIGERAFSGCDSLTSITIPNGVTSIGYSAFENCYSLTSVTIPDSVTSIEGYAFYGCSSLKTINYKGGKEQWDAISKGSDWNYGTGSYTKNYNYVEN